MTVGTIRSRGKEGTVLITGAILISNVSSFKHNNARRSSPTFPPHPKLYLFSPLFSPTYTYNITTITEVRSKCPTSSTTKFYTFRFQMYDLRLSHLSRFPLGLVYFKCKGQLFINKMLFCEKMPHDVGMCLLFRPFLNSTSLIHFEFVCL